MEGYHRISTIDLYDGMEVILEEKHFTRVGYPDQSDYFRTIVGHHRTVSGDMWHLVNEPSLEWPRIAPWYGHFIYAGNFLNSQMWARGEDDGKKR